MGETLIFYEAEDAEHADISVVKEKRTARLRYFRIICYLRGMHHRREQRGRGGEEFWRGFAGDLARRKANQ
jgi:hypothetical protein